MKQTSNKNILIAIVITITFGVCINNNIKFDNINEQNVLENGFKNIINVFEGHKSKVKTLYEESKIKQENNSMYIDVLKTQTYVRVNNNVDSYDEYIKYYKLGKKWSSFNTDNEPYSNGEIYTFISVFDGNALHDYVNVYEKSTNKTVPTDLSVNSGQILYEQGLKYGYGKGQTLQDVINECNSANNILHWFSNESKVKIKEDKIINGYPCTNIVLEDAIFKKEACVSKDYGVAIYLKLDKIDVTPFNVNKSIITEYEVKEIRNTERDSVLVDDEVFKLPDIKPQHIYGKY